MSNSTKLGRLTTLAVCILACAGSVRSQGNSPTTGAVSNKALADEIAKHPELVRRHRDSFIEAKDNVRRGNIVAAMAGLAGFNLAARNTAEWHLENCANLMQVAEQLTREGNKRDSASVVSESLRQLQSADRAAKAADDPAARGRAKVAAGFIQERYQGDPKAALTSYQEALELNPDDTATRATYERLRRSYETQLARAQNAKR